MLGLSPPPQGLGQLLLKHLEWLLDLWVYVIPVCPLFVSSVMFLSVISQRAALLFSTVHVPSPVDGGVFLEVISRLFFPLSLVRSRFSKRRSYVRPVCSVDTMLFRICLKRLIRIL